MVTAYGCVSVAYIKAILSGLSLSNLLMKSAKRNGNGWSMESIGDV
jgi:hypothetical protein